MGEEDGAGRSADRQGNGTGRDRLFALPVVPVLACATLVSLSVVVCATLGILTAHKTLEYLTLILMVIAAALNIHAVVRVSRARHAGHLALHPHARAAAERSRTAVRDAEAGPLSLPAPQWAALELSRQVDLLREGSGLVREWLRSLPSTDHRRNAAYVVVCGEDEQGAPRVIYAGNAPPPRALAEEAQARIGCRAIGLTNRQMAVEEGPGPGDPRREVVSGAPQRWAGGVREWNEEAERWLEVEWDRYPTVWVRISWDNEAGPSAPVASFLADIDTGAPFCAFPLEPLVENLGEAVATRMYGAEQRTHLGRPWECIYMKTDGLRFEVNAGGTWVRFDPMPIAEFVATRGWDDSHALCQVRPDRQAFVGRPIWRGAVKLTLESTGADWESAPPVTY